MSDPFAPQSNHKVLREAQASLSLIAILLIVFVYVTYYRMTGQGSRVPEHVLRAPVSEAAWSNEDDGQSPILRQSNNPRNLDQRITGRDAHDRSATRHGDRIKSDRSDRSVLNRGQQNPLDSVGPDFTSTSPNISPSTSHTASPKAAKQSPTELIAVDAASLNRKITDSLAAMDKIQASLKRSLEDDHADAESPAEAQAKAPMKVLNEAPPKQPLDLIAATAQPKEKEAAPAFNRLGAKTLGALGPKRLTKPAQTITSNLNSIDQAKATQYKHRQNTRIKVIDDRRSASTQQASTFSKPEPKLNAPRPIVTESGDASLASSRPLHFNGLRSAANSPKPARIDSPNETLDLASTSGKNESQNNSFFPSPRSISNLNSKSKSMTIRVTGAESVAPVNSSAAGDEAEVSNDFVGNVPAVKSTNPKGASRMPNTEPRTNNQVESFYHLPDSHSELGATNVVAAADSAPKVDLITSPNQTQDESSGTSNQNSSEQSSFAALSSDANSPPQLLNNSRQHVVQHGDSFWTIAQSRYGDGRYFRALYKYNELTVGSFDHLDVGTPIDTPDQQDLIKLYPKFCPSPEQSLPSFGITDANQMRSNQDASDVRFGSRPTRFERQASQYYVTRDGDTLFEIARQRLGQASRFSEIYDANSEQFHHDVGHLTQLRAGIKLKLPPASQ